MDDGCCSLHIIIGINYSPDLAVASLTGSAIPFFSSLYSCYPELHEASSDLDFFCLSLSLSLCRPSHRSKPGVSDFLIIL
jgi:hypothetical protein